MKGRDRLLAQLLAGIFFAAPAPAPKVAWPLTVPERTGYQATSRVAEVRGFLEALSAREPDLRPYGKPGVAEGGAPLLAWRLKSQSRDALRVHLNGNIHAGEVEGKEAIQLIVRELIQGRHPTLRRHLDLVVTPAYNADGTDALDPGIRRWQPNPATGVGRRENARGLDLNRDLMKAQAASTRFLLDLLRAFDPELLFDLHTTNGSTHGFHLTHTPASCLGGDAPLHTFNRRMLTEVRERLKSQGTPTYDYGDFEPDEPGRKGGLPERWGTVHPYPRYLANHMALRHRLGILSECYVYRSFPERVETTRRFVLECLSWAVEHRSEIRAEIRAAEQRWRQAWREQSPRLPLSMEPVATENFDFEVITPLRNVDRQLVGEKARQTMRLPAFLTWEDRDVVALPKGYLVDPIYADQVRPVLEAHGIRVAPGSARPKGTLLHFTEDGRELGKDAFQGVFPLSLRGRWRSDPPTLPRLLPWTPGDLDRALWVALNQPLGRVAFYLLDPRSQDGLVYWGTFHSALVRSRLMWGEPPRFPLLAVGTPETEPTPRPPQTGKERQE